MHWRLRVLVGLAAALIVAGARSRADAGCNVIPAAARAFPGSKGALSRPFAAPGEVLGVELLPCDSDTLDPDPAQHVVTVAFKPSALRQHLVVLTTDACSTIQPQVDACKLIPGVTAECRQIAANVDIAVGTLNGRRRLTFRFPDTRASGFPGFAGPAAVAVRRKGQPIPCGLATAPCASQSGLLVCADGFFQDDGTCNMIVPTTYEIDQFVALPPANLFGRQCHDEKPPCSDLPDQIQLALDGYGNALIPMNWQSVLSADPGVTLRLLAAALKWPAAIDIPSSGFLGSYSPDGVRLPPIFDPLANPVGLQDVVRLFGSTDAAYSVLRVKRFGQTCSGGPNANRPCRAAPDCPSGSCPTVCVGGANSGQSCTTTSTCAPNGQCGQLFDLGGQPAQGVGPVPIPWNAPPLGCMEAPHQSCSGPSSCSGNVCSRYGLRALFAARYPSLRTDDLSAFVVGEKSDQVNRNGDSDLIDDVILLQDRRTGRPQPIGATGGTALQCGLSSGTAGRAVVMGKRGPFSYPLAAVEGPLLAFLESEAGQNSCDMNGNGQSLDALVRIFKLGGSELTKGSQRTADEREVIDGKSLVLSQGRAFYRRGNGNLRLEVWDTAQTSNPTSLCPATAASVASGLAAFLRPEVAQGNLACPGKSLNGDADTDDTVVHLWTGGSVRNLARAATAVSLSPTWVGALVSEQAQGGTTPEAPCNLPGDRNCDGDTADNVVAVYPVTGSGVWINVGQAADTVQVSGETAAFISPEAAQGQDLNGDGDTKDRVLQLFYPSDPTVGTNGLVDVGQMAEEFVIGEPVQCDRRVRQFLAFRTSEQAQGIDLNLDGDQQDDVLQVIDILHPQEGVSGPHQAVTPCTLAACDPRLPYRVTGRTVRFLTHECDQGGPEKRGCPTGGTDLDRDGDAADIAVQVFDACVNQKSATAGTLAVGDLGLAANQLVDPLLVEDGSQIFFTTLPGRCVPTGMRPLLDDCGGGTVPDPVRGTCVHLTPATCASDGDCGANAFCDLAVLPVAVATADDDGDGIPDMVAQGAAFTAPMIAPKPAPEPCGFCQIFPWFPCCRDADR